METFPRPGNGYTIRERLGSGNWKTAYRASSMHSATDVAILYFHDETKQSAFTGEVLNQLKAAQKHKYSGYIAEFKGLQHDEDGRWYIIEELLARPLDKLGIINDIVRFVRIARDLSRGLACLHKFNLVHRDIKLENCGLDHQERAKIFDLGLVTSDPKDIRGNIFTRAPELFEEDGLVPTNVPQPASDVWALGATLFALRFGEYPFVHRSEVEERKQIATLVRESKITVEEGEAKKEKIRKNVRIRILKANAARHLSDRICEGLRGTAASTLNSMLSFDLSARLNAEFYAEEWGKIARELGGLSQSSSAGPNKWEEIEQNLNSALRRELALTKKQIERLATEIREERKLEQSDREKIDHIESLIKQIKSTEYVTSM